MIESDKGTEGGRERVKKGGRSEKEGRIINGFLKGGADRDGEEEGG